MKTKLLYGILGIFLMGIVVAGIGVINIDKEVEFEKNVSDVLIANGVEDLVREHKIDSVKEKAQTCFTEGYNLPCLEEIDTFEMNCTEINPKKELEETDEYCLTWEKIEYTNEEIEEKLDQQEKEYLEFLAGVMKQRGEVEDVTVISEGTLTVKEKGIFPS